ncbi:MAG: aldo/keto reductase [Spirulinaceae cyanobacterium SM2_1_0]|nr:aldo/keto reductase [Spirulinaceae cyanobacterium SM2_1_0]
MQMATLGKQGPTVSALGIGTWAWGDTFFWNYGKQYGAEQVRAAFEAAITAGITFFDTAEIYGFGKSESLLGEFCQQSPAAIDIATKYGPAPWRWRGEDVRDALSSSLERLQLTRATLYQVHWPFAFLMSQETLMNALADAVQSGQIAAVGVSNYSAAQLREAHSLLAKRGIPLAVNQMQYSLLHRDIERNGVLTAARELGITILAYSPLAQGLLTGKYDPENPQSPDGARRLDSRFSARGLQKIAPLLRLLRQLGDRYTKTPAQVALNWLVAQGDVIPIPGAKNAQQATQNAGALGWSLTPEEVAQLEQASRSF